jgi:hypothetical protein
MGLRFKIFIFFAVCDNSNVLGFHTSKIIKWIVWISVTSVFCLAEVQPSLVFFFTVHRCQLIKGNIVPISSCRKYIKGTVAWVFFKSKVISPKVPSWPPDTRSKEVSFEFAEIFDFLGPSALWASAANLVMRYGLLRRLGDALQATRANLVMRFGPLRRIWLCTVGHCGGFVYLL